MIGVLSVQGDFERHVALLSSIGVPSLSVRGPEQLEEVEGLVIPGGESTTIGLLMERFGLMAVIRSRVEAGLAVFGTCAGAILLADGIEGSGQPRLGVLPVTVRRNAYGRQVESFEADLDPPQAPAAGPVGLPPPPPAYRGVFIRAPLFTALGDGVVPLLQFEANPVLVRSGRLLAATFHPELTGDGRIHRYFVEHVVRAPADLYTSRAAL